MRPQHCRCHHALAPGLAGDRGKAARAVRGAVSVRDGAVVRSRRGPATPPFSVCLARADGQVIGSTLAGEMTAADRLVVDAGTYILKRREEKRNTSPTIFFFSLTCGPHIVFLFFILLTRMPRQLNERSILPWD
jgi:hypothetical protein